MHTEKDYHELSVQRVLEFVKVMESEERKNGTVLLDKIKKVP